MKACFIRALLFAAPVMALAFILLNTAFSNQPTELKEEACPPMPERRPGNSARDSDGDGMNDAYELFFGLNPANPADVSFDYDGDALTNRAESVKLTDPFCEDTDRDGFFDDLDEKISRVYIQWGDPQFTTGDQYEYAHPDWLLGAYKDGGEWVVSNVWHVSEYGSNGVTVSSGWRVSGAESNNVASLNIDLDRTILTNNLRYALHYSCGRAGAARRSTVLDSSLYVNLLDTNGVAVVEDLYGNLLSVSNSCRGRTRFVASDDYENSSVLILNVPLAKFSAAAVIQLRSSNVGRALAASPSSDLTGSTDIFVYEGLLYIDEDNDGLDADQEKQIGTSDYYADTDGDRISDYDEWLKNSDPTKPDGNDDGDDDGDDEEDDSHKKGRIIYVDQAIGNDQFTGRAPAVSANKKGPKKTVRGGLSIVETNDAIIIRSGTYNENLNIQGKDVKVFIEGNVRL